MEDAYARFAPIDADRPDADDSMTTICRDGVHHVAWPSFTISLSASNSQRTPGVPFMNFARMPSAVVHEGPPAVSQSDRGDVLGVLRDPGPDDLEGRLELRLGDGLVVRPTVAAVRGPMRGTIGGEGGCGWAVAAGCTAGTAQGLPRGRYLRPSPRGQTGLLFARLVADSLLPSGTAPAASRDRVCGKLPEWLNAGGWAGTLYSSPRGATGRCTGDRREFQPSGFQQQPERDRGDPT